MLPAHSPPAAAPKPTKTVHISIDYGTTKIAGKTKVSGEGIYRPGDRILVFDVGGGTSDLIAYEVQPESVSVRESDETDPDGTARSVKLVSMGNASGALSGSEFINQQFLRWLVRWINLEHLTAQYPGGIAALSTHLALTSADVLRHAKSDFDAVVGDYAHGVRSIYASGLHWLLEALDVSKAEFLDQANREFEKLKHGLTRHHLEPGSSAVHKFLIDSGVNHQATMEDYKVRLTRDELFAFFEPVLEKNFDLVRESLKTSLKTQTIIVIGGLRHSDYFMSRLEDEFPNVTIVGATNSSVGQPQPVSRGALWAFGIAEGQDLPSTDTYGISENQPFDPVVHSDLGPGKTVPGTFEAGVEYASQRWKTIVAPGRHTERTSIWQQRLVLTDEKDIHLQVYWSAVKREENSAILIAHDSDDTVPGVEKWALLIAPLPDLHELGFELQYPNPKEIKRALKLQSKADEDEDYNEDVGRSSTNKRKSRPPATPAKRVRAQTSANYPGKPARSISPSGTLHDGPRSTSPKNHSPPLKLPNPLRTQTPHRNPNPSNVGPNRAKRTPIRGWKCPNCTTSIPRPGVCTTRAEGARYEVWYRVVIAATGANVAVRWEMMANPRKSHEKALAEKDFADADLAVLFEDDLVEKMYNPNPLE